MTEEVRRTAEIMLGQGGLESAAIFGYARSHRPLVHQRLRDAWGIGPIGSKISDNIDGAIRLSKGVARDGDFIDLTGRLIDRVRTPNSLIRKADHVDYGELRLCVRLLLRDAGTTPKAELITAVARIFGWTRTGADIKSRLDEVVEQLVADSEITYGDEQLSLSGA